VHAEHALRCPQAHAFVQGVEHGGFEGVGVHGSGALGEEALLAGVTEVGLFALGVPAVFDGVVAGAVGTGRHGAVYIT
jgi:hypothetical protein